MTHQWYVALTLFVCSCYTLGSLSPLIHEKLCSTSTSYGKYNTLILRDESSFVLLLTPNYIYIFDIFCSNEKDNQGENMFMRCVSELVIESREVSGVTHFYTKAWRKYLCQLISALQS